MGLKFSNKLTIGDFREFPVWEFTNKHEHVGLDGELVVEPVRDIPVSTMDGRFIGTPMSLANDEPIFGVLIGIDLNRQVPISSLIVYREDKTFLFRRTAPRVSGPEQLASFLGLPIEDIFPISYDISAFASGDISVIRGTIPLCASAIPEGRSRKDYFRQILEERKRTA